MDDALVVKDGEDADHGRQLNKTRQGYRQALATAIAMLNDYLFTGAPSSHWLKGQQADLHLSTADQQPITAPKSGF